MEDKGDVSERAHVTVVHADGGVLRLRLSGRWTLDARPPVSDLFEHAMTTRDARVAVETDPQLEWDSGLLLFLRAMLAEAECRQMSVDLAGLPGGARRLLALASATPEYKELRPEDAAPSLLTRIGSRTIAATRSGADVLAFIGEACVTVVEARASPDPRGEDHTEVLGVAKTTGGSPRPPAVVVAAPTFGGRADSPGPHI